MRMQPRRNRAPEGNALKKWAWVAVLLLPMALCAPLAIPKSGEGWQPIRHRYDTWRACNELVAKAKSGVGGQVRASLRWWHLFGWKSELSDMGVYMWSWRTSLPTPAGQVRVAAVCAVEHDRVAFPGETFAVDSSGRWSLQQFVQGPVR